MRHDIRATRRGAQFTLAIVVGFYALFLAVPAANAATLSDIAATLQSTPVYVEAGNEADVSSVDADRLVNEVTSAGTPLYIAVITASSLDGRTIVEYTHDLGNAVGVQGTYAVVAGRNFYADSELFSVKTLADQSVAENKSGGANAILDAFITGVGALAAPTDTGGGTDGSGATTDPGTVDPGTITDTTSVPGDGMMGTVGAMSGAWFLMCAVGVFGIGAMVVRGISASSKVNRLTPEQLAALKATLDEDVTEFGEQATRVDANNLRLDDAGRADLATALNSYDTAKKAAESVASADGAVAVTNALQDGRFALACVQARLDGKPLPERRPPCFFDPRHGPSVQDVTWAPEGGSERQVPACQACVIAVADGREPAAREVLVGAGVQRRPYWMAGPMYAPYAGGYYSAWGGIFPGMMVGTMLAQHPMVNNSITPVAGNWMNAAPNNGGWMGGGGGGFGGGNFGGGGGGFSGGGGGGGGGFSGGGGGSF